MAKSAFDEYQDEIKRRDALKREQGAPMPAKPRQVERPTPPATTLLYCIRCYAEAEAVPPRYIFPTIEGVFGILLFVVGLMGFINGVGIGGFIFAVLGVILTWDGHRKRLPSDVCPSCGCKEMVPVLSARGQEIASRAR